MCDGINIVDLSFLVGAQRAGCQKSAADTVAMERAPAWWRCEEENLMRCHSRPGLFFATDSFRGERLPLADSLLVISRPRRLVASSQSAPAWHRGHHLRVCGSGWVGCSTADKRTESADLLRIDGPSCSSRQILTFRCSS